MKKYLLLTAILLINIFQSNAQYALRHYIAPSPWQYQSLANEIVVTTREPGNITATISKSNGTVITTLTLTANSPGVYRFNGQPMSTPRNLINTVYNDRGLIIDASGTVSVNMRNVASDATGTDLNGDFIKGNAAMLSYGDQGKGNAFRLGYYRSNYSGLSGNAPVYSVMATENASQVIVGTTALVTLDAGQSYLFKAPMGSLLSCNKPVVVNAGAYADVPGACSDGVVTQVIPNSQLGKNYIVIRGSGNSDTTPEHPEQSTIIATEAGTTVIINNSSPTGTIVGTSVQVLANPGDFITIHHGDAANVYSSSHIISSKPVIIYSGNASGCEVDMSVLMPYGECSGSQSFVLRKFTDYSNNDLDVFGYIITASPTEPVIMNGTNLESITGVFRTPIGSSGAFLIPFTSLQLGNPENYTFTSAGKISAAMIQQGGGYMMAAFFNEFNTATATPVVLAGQECNQVISAAAGLEPYQWYLNGIAINGASQQNYSPLVSGNYTVSATMPCGLTSPSLPVTVTVCADLQITKEITGLDNGSITFKLTAANNGPQNTEGATVTDILPSGYTYVSSTTTTGTYSNTTGIWNIGALSADAEVILYITAHLNSTGNHTNTATITGTGHDTDLTNNMDSVTPEGNLILTKTAAEEVYHNIGEVIVYELILTNSGNIALHNIALADENADAGSLIPSSITTLAVGESVTITASHTITEADREAGFVLNQATVIGESFNEIYVKTSSDNPATPEIEDATVSPILYLADITTVKTDGQDTYKPGTIVTYTITVTNNGPSDAQNVTISDPFPEGITVMNWASNDGNSGSGALLQALPILENGTQLVYTVTVEVPKTFKGELINTAAVTSTTPDQNPECSECTDTDTACTDCLEIQIPKGISPNGDTANESFDLSAYSIEAIEIFNRYGSKVYTHGIYTNEWHGQSDNGKELPTGTYFYVVNVKNIGQKTGWVYINR